MKVKIFSGYVADVEKELSGWVTSTNPKILHLGQSTTGPEPVLTVTVLYKD